ncbi:MAG: SidE phosphodiesterase domain-containing protein [Coxiellaceae bacterium]|nr:SidE phosphodiesterase domain-containing protein [Coxiellaceae bacterium]
MRTENWLTASHPLQHTAIACKFNKAKPLINMRIKRSWFRKSNQTVLDGIHTKVDSDLVRSQAYLAEKSNIPRHELMSMAANLAAHLKLFNINKKPMLIPCRIPVITQHYHNAATELLLKNINSLQQAYSQYIEKLKTIQQESADNPRNIDLLNCLNHLKQVQQILAGSLFLQKQYQLMQKRPDGIMAMTLNGYEQAEAASRHIALKYCAADLNSTDSPSALHLAASSGNTEQLHIILSKPETQINRRDNFGHSALYIAAKNNQLDAVKLLINQGAIYLQATDTYDSALTIALLNGHQEVTRYLSKLTPTKHNTTITHTALHQGPAKKNLALRHVEYIFHCLLGVDFISHSSEGGRYKNKANHEGNPNTFKLSRNSSNQLIAFCPNGKTYNLSLALQHANLCYFQLTEHDQHIISRCESRLDRPSAANATRATKLSSDIGKTDDDRTRLPCYAAEQAAVNEYTGNEYSDINAFLRGEVNGSSIEKNIRIFIKSMLSISGINKNIHFNDTDKRRTLIRGEDWLPKHLITQMKTTGRLVKRSGLISFSEKDLFPASSNKLLLQSNNQVQAGVASMAYDRSEREVIFPPTHMRFTAYKYDTRRSQNIFTTKIVHGVATDYHDEYLTTLAIENAFELLKMPYKDLPDRRFDVARHNHALAHHVRVSFYIEHVIEYFKHFAADNKCREFCDTLSPDEIIMMKIMMIFSKTGRESEVSPHSDIDTYMRYQQASAHNLAVFMRDHMGSDEKTISLYTEIMLHMGNPDYHSLVTGSSEQEKNHKLYINRITALAHKLDLLRVYDDSEYKLSMSGYNGLPQATTDKLFIQHSDQQRKALNKLESIAMTCLKATGDNLCCSKHGIDAGSYNEEAFKMSNSDIEHCIQQCHTATMQAIQDNEQEKITLKALMQSIKDNRTSDAIRLLAQIPTTALAKHNSSDQTALDIAINCDHDCSTIIDRLLLLNNHEQYTILEALHTTIEKNKTGYSLQLIRSLTTKTLNLNIIYRRALPLAINSRSNIKIILALLKKGVDINHYNDAILAACITDQLDVLQILLTDPSLDMRSLNHTTSTRPQNILTRVIAINPPQDVIMMLIHYGATVTQNNIIQAIKLRSKVLLELLITRISMTELNCIYNTFSIIDRLIHELTVQSHVIDVTELCCFIFSALTNKGYDTLRLTGCRDTALHRALVSDAPAIILQLLIEHAPLNYLNHENAYGQTPLMIAIENGNKAAVTLLLKRKVDTETRCLGGDTALIIAVKKRHYGIFTLLFNKCHSATFNNKNDAHHSAIYHATLVYTTIPEMADRMILRCTIQDIDFMELLYYFNVLTSPEQKEKCLQHFAGKHTIKYIIATISKYYRVIRSNISAFTGLVNLISLLTGTDQVDTQTRLQSYLKESSPTHTKLHRLFKAASDRQTEDHEPTAYSPTLTLLH